MSDPGPFPPPGQPPVQPGPPVYPAYPQPGYAPQGYPPANPAQPGPANWSDWAQAPGQPPVHPQAGYLPFAPAHKPGAIPLRPLGLGDMFDGAFKIIRFNPKATIGSAVLVTAVAMSIPIIVTGVLTLFVNMSLNSSSLDTSGNVSGSNVAGFLGAYGSTVIGSILQGFGLLFVTGMIVHVTAAAAVGRRLSLGEAWAATAGKRGALVGLSFLLGLITVVYMAVCTVVIVVLALVLPTAAAVLVAIALGVASLVGLVVFWIRVYYLAVPPLMLEPIGVGEAMRRSWSLSARQFWRILGIALLTMLLTRIVGGILGFPFGIVAAVATAAVNGSNGVLLFVAMNSLSAVVSSAFVAPFTAAVLSLQYIDQRIRKEGYDVELMTRAGITGL
ncbi:MAG: hypothetical protein JWR52_120 [Marmoricola sp.]|nr:hypothetical protein [Marmoricola sp.]